MSRARVFCETIPPPAWNGQHPLPTKPFFDVWRIPLSVASHCFLALKGFLSDEELVQAYRFLQKADQKRYILGRGFLRKLLQMYLKEDAKSFRFKKNRFNKPFLVGLGDFHFNVSHAGNWVVVALSSAPVGIDIEPIAVSFAYEEVVARFFESSEIDSIAESYQPHQTFFKLWTRKEAFLKAVGWGLSDQLHEYCLLDGSQSFALPEAIAHNDWKVKSFLMDKNNWVSTASPDSDLSPRYFDGNAWLKDECIGQK